MDDDDDDNDWDDKAALMVKQVDIDDGDNDVDDNDVVDNDDDWKSRLLSWSSRLPLMMVMIDCDDKTALIIISQAGHN